MQIVTANYPELSKLCWNMPGARTIDGPRALAIYEERWRHLDLETLTPNEKELIDRLATEHGGGRLCV